MGWFYLTSQKQKIPSHHSYKHSLVFSPLGLLSITSTLFSIFAITTSFIGVTLSLADFLKDATQQIKRLPKIKLALLIDSLTFIPSILFALFYPEGFMLALHYAGILVALLLIALPAIMQYKLNINKVQSALLLLASLVIVFLDAFF